MKDSHGNFVSGSELLNATVSFYKSLLAPQLQNQNAPIISVRKTLSSATFNALESPVTFLEIEKVILSANITKAPGVDGFSAGFYKAY